MSILNLNPELAKALHQIVFEQYAKKCGMAEDRFEIKIDPSLYNEMSLSVDYDKNKFIITTRHVPIGEFSSRFHAHMKEFFTQIFPRFVMDDGKYKYNPRVHSIEFRGLWNPKGAKEKDSRFELIPLYGVRVKDRQEGMEFSYIEEGTNMFQVRDKVISILYGESGSEELKHQEGRQEVNPSLGSKKYYRINEK